MVIFAPESVALIGATDRLGSVGRTILSNLIGSPFGGTIYPINPKRKNTLGLRTWPCLAALPDKAELAVIVTPEPYLVSCGNAQIRGSRRFMADID